LKIWKSLLLLHIIWLPAAAGVLCAAAAGAVRAAGDDKPAFARFEPAYVERSKGIDDGDLAARIDLAHWCREHGLIREMLNELMLVTDREPDNAQARGLLCQKAAGAGWEHDLPRLAALEAPAPGFEKAADERRDLLSTSRKQSFKMADKSFRFKIWSDLDRECVGGYARVLNAHYDRLKGFFQVAKTELGIDVLIFSKRSDYLSFYHRAAGKSGEHTNGFFGYGDGVSFLAFYDDRYKGEEVVNTAAHECTHLLALHCLRGAETALWFNEGLACYFAAGGDERSGPYAAGCLTTVRLDRMRGRSISLRDLMSAPRDEFGFDHYATAWSWICFLRSNPETSGKLGRILTRLRQRAGEADRAGEAEKAGEDDGEAEDGDGVAVDWESATNSLFEDLVGPPEKLQHEWDAFVQKDLVPLDGTQCLQCADDNFKKAARWHTVDPPLKPSEAIAILHEGEEWLRRASGSGDASLALRCRLENTLALLARARCLRYDEEEMVHAAAEAARSLDAFLCDPVCRSDSWGAGEMALRGLGVIWNSGDYENGEGVTCDFIAMIAEREEQLRVDAGVKNLPSLQKEMILKELGVVRFQKAVAGRLIAETRLAFSRALARDPAHRPAAHDWLYLALEFAPEQLDAVFPHVLFQAELDPDDVGLAALAAAYAAMGRGAYARTLLDRALHITPDKNLIRCWARYVE